MKIIYRKYICCHLKHTYLEHNIPCRLYLLFTVLHSGKTRGVVVIHMYIIISKTRHCLCYTIIYNAMIQYLTALKKTYLYR